MQIEDVAGVSFPSGRTTEEERELAISDGLLGKIIIDDQRMAAAVAEELGHRHPGIGGDELEGRRIGSGGGNDDGVIHGAEVLELVDNLSHRRTLLPDSDINADDVLPLLVNDGVESNGSLAGLAVADDQFTLATADRHHGVDRLETGLHRLMDRFTGNDAGGFDFDLTVGVGLDLAETVDGVTDAVDNATDEGFADRNLNDTLGALDGVAFFNVVRFAEDRRTDVVFFEVENHPHGVAGEFEQLAGHGLVEAIDTGDTVTDRDDRTGFADFNFAPEIFDLLLDNCADFFGSDFHGMVHPLFRVSSIRLS